MPSLLCSFSILELRVLLEEKVTGFTSRTNNAYAHARADGMAYGASYTIEDTWKDPRFPLHPPSFRARLAECFLE